MDAVEIGEMMPVLAVGSSEKSMKRLVCWGVIFTICAASCSKPQDVLKAKAEVNMLSSGVRAFRSEYGYYPGPQALGTNYADTFAAVLKGTPDSAAVAKVNPKHICFVEVATNRVIDGWFVDPWGNAYHFAFDERNQGSLKVGAARVERLFVIWSDGPNRLNEYGRGDDIRSW